MLIDWSKISDKQHSTFFYLRFGSRINTYFNSLQIINTFIVKKIKASPSPSKGGEFLPLRLGEALKINLYKEEYDTNGRCSSGGFASKKSKNNPCFATTPSS
jgi:hypothetical protein